MNVSNSYSNSASPNRKAAINNSTVTIEFCRENNNGSPYNSKVSNSIRGIIRSQCTNVTPPRNTTSSVHTPHSRKVLSVPGYGFITSKASSTHNSPSPDHPRSHDIGLSKALTSATYGRSTPYRGASEGTEEVTIRRKRIPANWRWDSNGRRYSRVVVDPNSSTRKLGSEIDGEQGNTSNISSNGQQMTEKIGRGNENEWDCQEKIDLPVYRGREHYALIQQVKNCLQEANEPPPECVNDKEVEERRKILTKMLEKLQDEWHQTSLRNHQLKLARRNRAIENEEKKKADIIVAEKMKELQFMFSRANYNDERDERNQKRNQRILEKAFKCKEFQEKIMMNRIENLEEENKIREMKLQKIEQDRDRAVADLRQRKKAQQEMAFEIRMRNQRKEDDLAEYKRRRMLAIKSLLEKRETEIKAAKDEEIRKRNFKINDRRAKGPLRRTHILMKGANGSSELINCAMTHEERVRASEMADAEQRKRYNEEEEFRREFQKALKMKRKIKEDKRRENHDRLIEDRLKRYDDLLQKDRKKSQYVMQMRQEIQTAFDKEAECLNMDLEYHQKRSKEILEKKSDDVAKKRFVRWNQRGSVAMMAIMAKYGAIAKGHHSKFTGDYTNDYSTDDGSVSNSYDVPLH